MGSSSWRKVEVAMDFLRLTSVKFQLPAGPLTLESSTIFPRSADIALSFVLNYGVDRFQVKSFTFLKVVLVFS